MRNLASLVTVRELQLPPRRSIEVESQGSFASLRQYDCTLKRFLLFEELNRGLYLLIEHPLTMHG